MLIEAGKTYLTRDGARVGPMVYWPRANQQFPWFSESSQHRAAVSGWGDSGRYRATNEDDYRDLVALYPASAETEGPVRVTTVTRHEIVPGNYGRLKVGDPLSLSDHVSVAFCLRDQPGSAVSIAALTAEELRAAAKVLTELATALEGGAK